MDHIGIDVHKRESQIYILAEGGEVVEQRIRTEAERFGAVLGSRPRARIVIEASTDREWVARCLEALGPEVIVADPNALRSAYPPRSQMGARKRTRVARRISRRTPCAWRLPMPASRSTTSTACSSIRA